VIRRNDLLSPKSPAGLEIYQLTQETAVPSCHIYMEAQIFSPDSKRFILHRSAHAHGSNPKDPEHRYFVCDLENKGELIPITHEPGATAPSISPDGKILYYFVDETSIGAGRLLLKKVNLDGAERETLLVIDSGLQRPQYRPSKPYPLSTISSDGRRIAISAFLGDGQIENAPWGLLVFDLQKGFLDLIIEGQSWCNMHPQYCRSLDPEQAHDILIQENHGNVCDLNGNIIHLVGGAGADIHLLRDDGTHFRNLAWGRDGNEFCQGHQCWIGASAVAITSTDTQSPRSWRLIAGRAVEHTGHVGILTPGGWRNDLTRNVERPDFFHFATDSKGQRLISDAGPMDAGGSIHLATLPSDESEAFERLTYLFSPRCSWKKGSHIHPFLSPDGSTGFFNSDESGILQAYLVRGW